MFDTWSDMRGADIDELDALIFNLPDSYNLDGSGEIVKQVRLCRRMKGLLKSFAERDMKEKALK